jgi:hypothetical protein
VSFNYLGGSAYVGIVCPTKEITAQFCQIQHLIETAWRDLWHTLFVTIETERETTIFASLDCIQPACR